MISMLVEPPRIPMTRNISIMLVDDSKVVRKRLKEMLAEICSECEILEADAPSGAIPTLEHPHIDVVVKDIRMPGGSGMDAIAEVKRAQPDALVIMLTNYSESYYRNRCIEMGADLFFDKSSEFDLVIDAVSTLINS